MDRGCHVRRSTSYVRGHVCLKIDWTLWPSDVPELVAARGLTDSLDVGYRVLLDKDGTSARWAQPTYRAHIPRTLTKAEYVAFVEEFFGGARRTSQRRVHAANSSSCGSSWTST